jgi:hypothetical protein
VKPSLLLSMLRMDLRKYFSSRVAVFWTCVFPVAVFVLMMQVYGSGKISGGDLALIVVDHDKSEESYRIIDTIGRGLSTLEALSVRIVPGILCEPAPATACLEIPTRFGALMDSHARAELRLDAAALPHQPRVVLSSVVSGIVDRFDLDLDIGDRRPVVVTMAPRESDGHGESGRYLAIGMLVFSMMSTSLMGLVIPLVAMRQFGTFKIFQAMPLNPSAFVASLIGSRTLIMIGFAIVFLAAASVLYRIPIALDFKSLCLWVLGLRTGSMTLLSLGMLLASRSHHVATATVGCNAAYYPLAFLGDLFVPRSRLPVVLSGLLDYSPVNNLGEALRTIAAGGATLSIISHDLLIVVGWGALFQILSWRFFLWHEQRQ